MNFKINNISKLLERAMTSTCPLELEELHECEDMNVRRVVAKNTNITTEIANALANDPVLNVCYMAIKNPKTTIKRNLDPNTLTECVICEEDERYMNCMECYQTKNWSLLNN